MTLMKGADYSEQSRNVVSEKDVTFLGKLKEEISVEKYWTDYEHQVERFISPAKEQKDRTLLLSLDAGMRAPQSS